MNKLCPEFVVLSFRLSISDTIQLQLSARKERRGVGSQKKKKKQKKRKEKAKGLQTYHFVCDSVTHVSQEADSVFLCGKKKANVYHQEGSGPEPMQVQ